MSQIAKTVRVWKDPEWNDDGPGWIVSIDWEGKYVGPQSEMQSTHRQFADAKKAGERVAEETGYPLEVVK